MAFCNRFLCSPDCPWSNYTKITWISTILSLPPRCWGWKQATTFSSISYFSARLTFDLGHWRGSSNNKGLLSCSHGFPGPLPAPLICRCHRETMGALHRTTLTLNKWGNDSPKRIPYPEYHSAFKRQWSQVRSHTPVILGLRRHWQDCCEFKSNLVYLANAKPARANTADSLSDAETGKGPATGLTDLSSTSRTHMVGGKLASDFHMCLWHACMCMHMFNNM